MFINIVRNITFLINFIKIMKSIKEKKERKKTNLEILLKDIFTLIKFIKRVDVKIEIKPSKTLTVHVIVRLRINIE